MTLTYQLKKIKTGYVFLTLLLLAFPSYSNAQIDSVSLSVTPTLFEMAAMPSQAWNSSVKVINNNPFNLTVYANVMNFAPQGETGQGKFVPVYEEVTEGATLAEWIEISNEPIVLAPGASQQIPIVVKVPADATPGGHFAAIMVGTRPPDKNEAFQIKTSQIVTSLFFVRIAGDVVEDGSIREFKTSKNFYQKPEANFEVRFENKGNVHIQPQGEILIKNMWGKERGVIPINHQTHFGNVLPESIRKFEFTWKGESDFSDIGRYSAELTLAYGTDSRKFVTSKTYFWVVPVKPVLSVLAFIVASIYFMTWAVRAYVRRMLALEGYQPLQKTGGKFIREGDVLINRRQTIEAPVKAGWLDLTKRIKQTTAFIDTIKALVAFVWQYRIFFGTVIIVIVIIMSTWHFISSGLVSSRDYEISIDNPDKGITLSSEEILYEKQKDDVTASNAELPVVVATSSQTFELYIVNSSDTPGAAATMQRRLEGKYEITKLRSDFGVSKDRSVIVYHRDLQVEALALREIVGDFILSTLPPEEEAKNITIYIGNDYVSE